jgi:hypothetical protein
MAEGLKGVGAIGLDVFRKAFFLPTARRIEVEKTGREPSGSLAGMNRFAGNITGISTAITLLNGGSLPTGYLSIYLLTVCATNLASSIYEKGRERYIEDQKQKNSAK